MRGDIEQWEAEVARTEALAARADDRNFSLRNTHLQIGLDAIAFGDSGQAERHLAVAARLIPDFAVNGDALILGASSFERTLRGEFVRAAELLDRAYTLPHDGYTTEVHLRVAQLALGICSGDHERLSWQGDAFLDFALARGFVLAAGLVGGPYAWELALRGRQDDARRWLTRIADVLSSPHRFMFAVLATAQFGAPETVALQRGRLAARAAVTHRKFDAALLALFDAYAASRGLEHTQVAPSAASAATHLEEIDWPWFAARAFALAGDSARALALYRRIGARADIRSLEADDVTANGLPGVLSPREREVAELVALAKSNKEIARTLKISLKTVEKHVSAALVKLHFTSRAQLARFLTEKK